MVADPDWLEHCAKVRSGLLELRPLFGDNKEVQHWFDEYIEANELELALHVVCEFLVARTSRQIGPEEVTLIRALHEKMNIADDCCSQLQQYQT
jgi:hypothetical protein